MQNCHNQESFKKKENIETWKRLEMNIVKNN